MLMTAEPATQRTERFFGDEKHYSCSREKVRFPIYFLAVLPTQ